jgi:hypothetical protein
MLIRLRLAERTYENGSEEPRNARDISNQSEDAESEAAETRCVLETNNIRPGGSSANDDDEEFRQAIARNRRAAVRIH